MSSRYYSVTLDGPTIPFDGVALFRPESTVTPTNLEDDGLLDRVRGLDYGHLLLDGSALEGVDDAGIAASLVVCEDLRRSREASGRTGSSAIRFGQLVISTMLDREVVVPVAVKPFETTRAALHEYCVMRYLNHRSSPPQPFSSYIPLGFYANTDDGLTSVVTVYDHSVISYDNLFYNPERQPTGLEVEKAIGNCARALAYLHTNGLRFGDAQVKNFACDSRGVRLIDPESVRTLRSKRGNFEPNDVTAKTLADIGTFVRSIGLEDFGAFLRNTFVAEYLRMVARRESTLPSDCRLTPKQIVEVMQ